MAIDETSVKFSGLGAVLKEEWSDEVTTQFNNEALCYTVLSEGAEDELWQGEYYVEPVHTGRHRSGSAGRETDKYPDVGSQKYEQMQIGVSFYRTSGRITSKAMLAAEQGDASAIRALTSEIRGALRDLILEVNVDCYGTRAGVLAALSASAEDQTLELKNAFDGGVYWNSHGTRYLSGGRTQPIMIGTLNADTGALDVNHATTVTSITDRNTIEMAAALHEDGTDADLLFRQPSSEFINGVANPTMNFGLCGLEEMISDGGDIPAYLDTDYYGINRSTSSLFKSEVRDMGGDALTEGALQNFLDAIGERSGETPDCLLMHRSVRTKLVDLFSGDRRFTPQQYAGGFKGEYLVYNPGDGDIDVFVDRHATYKTIYAINKDYMKRYTLSGAHLVDYDGSALRQKSDSPSWEWNVEAYFQMASTKPNTCGKLYNMAADETFGNASFLPEF